MFAGRLVDYDKLAHIVPLQLLISIQKLNAIDSGGKSVLDTDF